MVVNGLDMSYLGVSNVWTNDMGRFIPRIDSNNEFY